MNNSYRVQAKNVKNLNENLQREAVYEGNGRGYGETLVITQNFWGDAQDGSDDAVSNWEN